MQGQTRNPDENSLYEIELDKENQHHQYWCLGSEGRAGSGRRVAGDTNIHGKLITSQSVCTIGEKGCGHREIDTLKYIVTA